MKQMTLGFLLISSLMLFPAGAASALELEIFPTSTITTLDPVHAQLSGEFPTTGYKMQDPQVTLLENNIGINFNASSPQGPVLQIITPFSIEADIGLLDAGTYQVNAFYFLDGNLQATWTDAFTVSPVPIPVSIWLFASGLIILFCLNKRSNITA
jgi:hypothetical protein